MPAIANGMGPKTLTCNGKVANRRSQSEHRERRMRQNLLREGKRETNASSDLHTRFDRRSVDQNPRA